jgi:hypothetical protein
MTRENLNLLFHIEGLSLLGIFLAGYMNEMVWYYAGFYILLPLFLIVSVMSYFAMFSKKTDSFKIIARAFFWFNFITLIGLSIFIFWAGGGTFLE